MILIFAGSLLYFFNSCDGKFQANTVSSLASPQCKSQVAPQAAEPNPPSPFANKKLHIDRNIAEYVAVIDNNCLKTAALNSLAKDMQGSAVIESEWDRQPYKLIKSESDLLSLEDEIEADPCIVGISPNRKYFRSALTTYFNDPSLAQQPHLVSINLEGALAEVLNGTYGINQTATGFAPVVIAILDTGVNYNHTDLANVIQRLPQGPGVEAVSLGTGTVNYDGQDIAPEAHGTHVAGLAAAQANNSIGGSGSSGGIGVRVLPVNVFFTDAGDVVSDSATIIKGINFAVQQRASVINMSLGGSGDDPAVRAAIQAAINAGTFIVASAGNTSGAEVAYEIGAAQPIFPAIYGSLAGMLTVGSTDSSTGAKSFFSLYSPTLVEISAPGSQTRTVGLYSTSQNQGYSLLQGTSMAAPVVAGAAALAQAFYRYHYRADLTPAQLESALQDSSTKTPALATFFKQGNQLDMARLILTLQNRYPLLKGLSGTTSNENCL
jgi:subtilisin family serine protease